MLPPIVIFGRLIFIHLQRWEVLLVVAVQRQRCTKFRVLTKLGHRISIPLALKLQKKAALASTGGV